MFGQMIWSVWVPENLDLGKGGVYQGCILVMKLGLKRTEFRKVSVKRYM